MGIIRKVWQVFKHDWSLPHKYSEIPALEAIIKEHLANGCERCQWLFGHIYQ
jgi:hypothetical protein